MHVRAIFNVYHNIRVEGYYTADSCVRQIRDCLALPIWKRPSGSSELWLSFSVVLWEVARALPLHFRDAWLAKCFQGIRCQLIGKQDRAKETRYFNSRPCSLPLNYSWSSFMFGPRGIANTVHCLKPNPRCLFQGFPSAIVLFFKPDIAQIVSAEENNPMLPGCSHLKFHEHPLLAFLPVPHNNTTVIMSILLLCFILPSPLLSITEWAKPPELTTQALPRTKADHSSEGEEAQWETQKLNVSVRSWTRMWDICLLPGLFQRLLYFIIYLCIL